MARYFFHVTDNSLELIDTHGDHCASEDEIRDNAICILVQMVEDELPGGDQHEFCVKVTDERGDLVFSAELELRSRWMGREQVRAAGLQDLGPTAP